MRRQSLADGRAAAEDLLSKLLGVRVHKAIDPLSPEGFLLIGDLVAKKLAAAVVGQEKAVISEIIKELDFDWKKATPQAATAAMNAINDSIRNSYTKKVLPKIGDVLVVEGGKVMKGTKASVIAREKFRISSSLKQRDRDAEEAIRKSHVNFIRQSTGKRTEKLSAKARSIVTRGLREGLGNDVIAKDLKAHFAQNIPRPISYWRTVADSFVGRARTTSQIYSYEDASIESLEVVAVIDEVTTDQCRFMDGKVFSVSSARAMLDSLSELEDPEEVRYANPWIRKGRDANGGMHLFVPHADGSHTSIAKIERSGMGKVDDRGSFSNTKSSAELSKLGVPCPPFHGRCRTTVVASSEPVGESARVMVPGADLEPSATPPIAPAGELDPETATLAEVQEVVDKLDVGGVTTTAGSSDLLDAAAKKAREQLTQAERQTLDNWMGSSYKRIRAADKGDSKATAHDLAEAKRLRDLMSKHAYEVSGHVFRGLTADPKTAAILLTEPEIEFDAMASWSTARLMANSFADGLTTDLGEKSKRLPVVFSLKDASGFPIGGGEEELLVPKDRYRIVARGVDMNGRLRIEVEPQSRGATVPDDKKKTKKNADTDETEEPEIDAAAVERFGSDGDDISFPTYKPKKTDSKA